MSFCIPAGAQTPTPTPAATTGLRLNSGTPSGLSAFTAAGTSGTTTTLATIFGGYTGPSGTCAPATAAVDATCNSCTTTLAACSTTSVHPALRLSIPLISNTAATFTLSPQIRWKFSSEGAGVTHAVDTAITPQLNVGFNAEITWEHLCQFGGNNAACTSSFSSGTLSVGIDNNNDGTFEEKVDFNFVFRYVDGSVASTITTCPLGVASALSTNGICYFSVAKGDEKVYISEIIPSANAMPTSDASIKYDRIALFFLENATSPTQVTPASSSIILSLQNNDTEPPSIADPRIRGLVNLTPYCFLLGNMDQTGIISNFPDPASAGMATTSCATPEVVVGLLDNKECFIATATFGSQMAPEVVTFREFRNKFLLTNSIGKAFVKNYYKFGPIAAHWISESETLRAASLGILWPLLLFVKLSLALGMIPAALILLMSAIVLAKLWTQFRRNRARTF